MKKEPFFRSLYASIYRYSVALFSRLMMVIGAVILITLFISRDYKHRADLRNALTQASADLSHLFVAYDAAGMYTPMEILKLTRAEVDSTLQSRSSQLSNKVFLQAINTREKIYYDSRIPEILKYPELDRLSFTTTPRFGSWQNDPVLYVDWDLTADVVWILRAGVTWKTYLVEYLKIIAAVIPLCGVLIVTYRALSEAYRRRRFDQFVASMVKILRRANEETLINAAPEIIARMLDFDAVGLYLREGDRIVPKAGYLPSGDIEAFLRSTDKEQITIDSGHPESRVLRGDASTLIADPRTEENIHQSKLGVTGHNPYVIAPMRSDEQRSAIGLLTAQHHRGLQPEHKDFLGVAAQLVALLIEKFNTQERMYRQMIRSTRTVSIGTVVPFVAHNMKTPLTIIAQLTKSIRGGLDGSAQEESREMLDGIKEQIELCFDLLQSISRYNKIEGSASNFVRINDGLDKVCDFFLEYFRIKGITLEKAYTASKAGGEMIKIEELDFVQVITNLLVNADEAFAEMIERNDPLPHERGFQIVVRAETFEDDSRIFIAVEDNGPGIPSEHIEQIFEDTFTTKEFGTGVGLPYCRRVIEQAGGKLTVKSQGRGARFSIVLPILH